MSFCFLGMAQDNTSSEVEKSEKNAKIGFGVYSSANIYQVRKLSNGLFVSKGKFRLIGLLDISRFDYQEPYSVSGGQIQLDYSLLKNTRFNPYIGLNFNHLRYTYGGGEFASQKLGDPYYPHIQTNAYDNSFNLVAGLDAKVYKGISLVTHFGAGINHTKRIRRPSTLITHDLPESNSFSYFRTLLISIGLKINVNEFF